MAKTPHRALVIEVASPLLDRLESALRHASAVASQGRPVWLVLSGEAVKAAPMGGLQHMRRANGQLYPSVSMRQETLGLADAETHFDAFRSLPTRLIVIEEDAIDYGLTPEVTRRHPPVEHLSRGQLINEANSDAWMVF